ncbi:MAG: hypothetical protein CTY36_06340 [Methylocystis sp.]|nr:MAG: hypothetical protein CTY36_06340 [Methylocystis sp.]
MINLESLERALCEKPNAAFPRGALATPLPIWAKPRGKGRASALGEAKNSPRKRADGVVRRLVADMMGAINRATFDPRPGLVKMARFVASDARRNISRQAIAQAFLGFLPECEESQKLQ